MSPQSEKGWDVQWEALFDALVGGDDGQVASICLEMSKGEETRRRGYAVSPLWMASRGPGAAKWLDGLGHVRSLSALDCALALPGSLVFESCLDALPAQKWGHGNLRANAFLCITLGRFDCLEELSKRADAASGCFPSFGYDVDLESALCGLDAGASASAWAACAKLVKAGAEKSEWKFMGGKIQHNWIALACHAWFGASEPEPKAWLSDWVEGRPNKHMSPQNKERTWAWANASARALEPWGYDKPLSDYISGLSVSEMRLMPSASLMAASLFAMGKPCGLLDEDAARWASVLASVEKFVPDVTIDQLIAQRESIMIAAEVGALDAHAPKPLRI